MSENPETSRRTAIKLVGSTAFASGLPALATSPGGAAKPSDPPAYRDWIPQVWALDDEALEFVYLDLEQIRTSRELRADSGLTGYLEADTDSALDDLPAIIRIPLSITLSLTISSLGILFFGNIISIGWDDDEEDGGPDLRTSSLLWVNGVTVIKGSFGTDEAVEAIQSERDGYEAVGTQNGFDLYEREYDSLLDTFGRDGRSFAVSDDTLVVSLREDGLERVQTVIETFAGDRKSQHEQDEQFDWVTRETSASSITAGSVESTEIDGVSLSDEVSDLADARVFTAGIDADGWNTTGLLAAGFEGDAPDEWGVETSIQDASDLSIESDNGTVSVTDSYE